MTQLFIEHALLISNRKYQLCKKKILMGLNLSQLESLEVINRPYDAYMLLLKVATKPKRAKKMAFVNTEINHGSQTFLPIFRRH